MNKKEALVEFKDLKITRQELLPRIGNEGFARPNDMELVEINAYDVIHLLKSFQNGSIDVHRLLDWVNTIWFTGYYSYKDEQCDCIASVMNRLEEIDENGFILDDIDIDKYIQALTLNVDLSL